MLLIHCISPRICLLHLNFRCKSNKEKCRPSGRVRGALNLRQPYLLQLLCCVSESASMIPGRGEREGEKHLLSTYLPALRWLLVKWPFLFFVLQRVTYYILTWEESAMKCTTRTHTCTRTIANKRWTLAFNAKRRKWKWKQKKRAHWPCLLRFLTRRWYFLSLDTIVDGHWGVQSTYACFLSFSFSFSLLASVSFHMKLLRRRNSLWWVYLLHLGLSSWQQQWNEKRKIKRGHLNRPDAQWKVDRQCNHEETQEWEERRKKRDKKRGKMEREAKITSE